MSRLLFRLLRVACSAAVLLAAITSSAMAQDLLVSSMDNGIRRYDGITGAPKGDFVSPGSGGLNGPTGFVFGPDGNLYVSSIYTRSIKRYNGVTGVYIDEFVPAGSGGGIEPYEIVFGPDGNLYVANGGDFGDAGVKRFSGTTGTFVDEFIPDLIYTSGITFGPDGNLYLTDGGYVRRYNRTTGAFIDTIATFNGVDLPTVAKFGTDGFLYVDYFYGHRIERFNVVTGADLGAFVPAGSGGLFWVYHIGFGPDHNLYTTERYSNAVYRFDGTTGAPLGTFASGIPGEVLCLNWFPSTPINNPPTAIAGPNQTSRPGIAVMLDGTASFDDNTPTASLQYSWTFSSKPPDSNATISGASTSTPSFVPDVAGTYVVDLIVTDGGALSSAPSSVIVADNPPPTANAGLDKLVTVSDVVTLAGTGVDPNLETLTYQWQLLSTPPGNTATISNATSASVMLIPNVTGTYIARFTVSDPLGPGLPDDVQIEVVTTGTFVEIKMHEAAQMFEQLPASAFPNSGNENALLTHIGNTAKLANQGNYADALDQLNQSISRTDGCALRGSPDGNGPDRDWIITCSAQSQVYPLLIEALAALVP